MLPKTSNMAPCGSAPRPGCIPSSRFTPVGARARRGRSCAAPGSSSRSTACRLGRTRRRGCGCGAGRHAGAGPAVASLRPPLRSGAHAAFPQTAPGLDDAARPASRASRSRDLAGGGRLYAVATSAAVGGGSPSAVGAPLDSGTLTPTRVRMMPPRGPYRTGRTVREWRRDMRTWFAFVVALLLVLSAPGFVLAQDTSPVAEEGMPEGAAFEILAQRLVEEFPTGPAEIGFARLTLPRHAPQSRPGALAGPGCRRVRDLYRHHHDRSRSSGGGDGGHARRHQSDHRGRGVPG